MTKPELCLFPHCCFVISVDFDEAPMPNTLTPVNSPPFHPARSFLPDPARARALSPAKLFSPAQFRELSAQSWRSLSQFQQPDHNRSWGRDWSPLPWRALLTRGSVL